MNFSDLIIAQPKDIAAMLAAPQSAAVEPAIRNAFGSGR
jgi:hypothetical protein